MPFTKIDSTDIPGNPVQLIGYDWMLITAGSLDHFNTMTAAWGGLGFLWNRPFATIFIRPQRYTYEFAEKYSQFTLSFFGKEHKKALQLCGTKSGRDMDKVKAAGLTPLSTEHGNVFFEEAQLMIECEKVYYDDIKPEHFIDTSIAKNYPAHDYHRMYFGFIINSLLKTL